MCKTHFFFILGGFKTFYFSVVKSWRGPGKIFGLCQGEPGFFFDAETYKPPPPDRKFWIFPYSIDGMVRRDAHECFDRLMNIVHEGTKSCLVDMNVSANSIETLTTSYPKSLFQFTTKKLFKCRNCGEESSFCSQSSTLNVYPAISCRMHLFIVTHVQKILVITNLFVLKTLLKFLLFFKQIWIPSTF